MEEPALYSIGETAQMSEEKLYQDEPIDYEEFILDDGGLDVEAWIIRSTYEIWDLQMPGRIEYYYDDDCVIHAANGNEVEGTDEIIEHTLNWQSAFPGIKIKILDVLWEGNEENGYKTSMPSYMIGKNTGHSQFGPPTGKELTRDNNLSIYNCLIEKVDGRWQYTEEWSNYDNAAMEWACTSEDRDAEEDSESPPTR
ncbi:ester cyclase [Halobellus sp. EA9]|uniref:ester cyclase n=1 Tax=Halobellus sp. EA9 TaxID=3421647 RepID=UPI003EB85F9F